MSFFTAEEISVDYGKGAVIEAASFSVDQGSITGIIGSNGCGKTTLLKGLCGILPHRGKCTLEGVELEYLTERKIARLCSYIPQRSGINLDISALDVVLMGFNPRLHLLEAPSGEMKQVAIDALVSVGLSERINENYMHLSEGQKQLCILARTLASGCKLLLLDEPESALDFGVRYKAFDLLRAYVEQGRAAIVTLHDPMLALNYCDKLLLISEGRLSAIIHPKQDSIPEMEQMLSTVYGRVTLQKCLNKNGTPYLVMLKESV